MNKIQLLKLLPLLLLLAISSLLATGLFNSAPTQGPMVGKTLPDFNIDLINSSTIKMTQQSWRGQVAVINIFASWCRPCQTEHASLMKLAQSGKVNVYGIAWHDTAQNVLKYLNAMGNPYQLVGNDQFGRTTLPLALTGVPETLVVDRDGLVHYHFVSAIDDKEVNNVILPLIDRLNAAHATAR